MTHMKTILNFKLFMIALMGITYWFAPECSVIPQAYAAKESKEDRKRKSLNNKIQNLERRIENYNNQIELIDLKIELHEKCRCCSTGNCRGQGSVRGCRHWAVDKHNGRNVKVCHQLPHNEQREAGIDQAISVLNKKKEMIQTVIARCQDKIAEAEAELNN